MFRVLYNKKEVILVKDTDAIPNSINPNDYETAFFDDYQEALEIAMLIGNAIIDLRTNKDKVS